MRDAALIFYFILFFPFFSGAAMHIIRDFEAGLFDSDMLLECATLLFASVGDVNKMRQVLQD
jgi:hypothetical protein